MPESELIPPRRMPDDKCYTPNPKTDFVELGVTTCFSFLQGASDAIDLVTTAAATGHHALGVADLNTMAGVVRLHTAAIKAHVRPIIGCRIQLITGEEFLAYPTDRAAYGRICTVLSQGKMTDADGAWQAKGACHITLPDLATHSEGTHLIAIPPEDLRAFAKALPHLAHDETHRRQPPLPWP